MFGCPVIESSKRHADGKVPRYDYTPDGKLARRVWARGIVTDYTYDNAGNLTCTEYNDNGVTPTVKMSYDRAGNLVNATTAGVVTNLYAYDIYGGKRVINCKFHMKFTVDDPCVPLRMAEPLYDN